jgi:hypothetical protein
MLNAIRVARETADTNLIEELRTSIQQQLAQLEVVTPAA